MKKLFLAFAMILGVMAVASARDTYAHDDSVLPEAARTTISKHFNAKVSVVKIDKDWGRVSEYEVVLTDGSEITFDRSGNWKDIETAHAVAVPAAFIPDGVKSYITKNHPGTHVVGIDKEKSGYEVELSNGVDLKFNRNGQFVRYDD